MIDPNWQENYFDVFMPNIDLVSCKKCSAMVLKGKTQEHLEWHEHLRKAVDETGILD